MYRYGDFTVVAPSLTPVSYNSEPEIHAAISVVAPSLTPVSYNQIPCDPFPPAVVAPSLTPVSYNLLASTPRQAWLGGEFFHGILQFKRAASGMPIPFFPEKEACQPAA